MDCLSFELKFCAQNVIGVLWVEKLYTMIGYQWTGGYIEIPFLSVDTLWPLYLASLMRLFISSCKKFTFRLLCGLVALWPSGSYFSLALWGVTGDQIRHRIGTFKPISDRSFQSDIKSCINDAKSDWLLTNVGV